ncbi:MAG TPA: FAD-dependent oxidoreductase [Bryobacteraceae bacterium]|nr:FAD-dependent oxidoreductase [Bryobacteraceae bacterium]
MTRRELIWHAARTGGFGAAFVAMRSMDLLATPLPVSTPFEIPPNSGRGTKVAILGAGIAGLVAAYEMRRAGFDCTLLEARLRPGGRNWTIRRGEKVEFIDGTVQQCSFDQGQYLNAGAARIPSLHQTMLGYCKELGVAMEVEVNTSRSTLLESDKAFGGRPVEQREVINDARGHVAELLAKAIRQGSLDQEVTREDRERMLAFLRSFGDLRSDYVYAGSSRAGLKRLPGAAEIDEERREPLPMHALLDASFWPGLMVEEGLDFQATMFQPVGGMDRIAHAFAQKLGKVVKYGCPVKEIRKTPNGVRVVYTERGAARSLEASYCICTLPLSLLKTTQNDFSPRVSAAVNQVGYAAAYKIAWESRRFWEQENNIYGGISWLSGGPISVESSTLANVWYPSGGMFSEKGVVVAGYGTESGEFGRLPSIEAKFAASRAAVERLHPGRSKELTKPLYVSWSKIPFNLGSWVLGNGYHEGPYREFLIPDDRIYFAGDHCSHLTTWQEGAALSAQRAVEMIVKRMRETA